MSQPSCIFYTTSPELRDLAEQLEIDGVISNLFVRSGPEEFLQAVAEHRPEIVFADLGFRPDEVLDLLEKLPVPRPLLLVCGPSGESGPILRSMRMGAREYFDQTPSEAELRRTIERLAAETDARDTPPAEPARVVAVMGAKGGVGATVVACQLAASLKRGGARVAVVDLNLPLGDVALHFDVQPAYTLANIGDESERLDATYLRTLLQGAPDGVRILAAPTRAEEAELVRGAHVERVLELLRNDFDWVVLDVSRSWNEPSVRALDLADQILLVTLMDVPTLSHTRQHLDLLERLGHAGKRIRLVANRYSKNDAVTERDVHTFLDRTPDFRIPNDYRATLAGLNQGVPVSEVAPRSAIAQAYADLSMAMHEWCGVEAGRTESSSSSLSRAVRGMFRRS